jgi:N-acetylmuramoyl-L-alanine amidase
MAYLDDHPPARSQFRCPRREVPSGVVVVHTAENTPDTVATDGGAEAVARFIQGRPDPGSYHDLVDSDSAIQLVEYGCEAYHDATGSNRHSYGVSIATTAAWWPLAPAEWRNGAIRQAAHAAARYARWVKARTGTVIPAHRISREQSENRVPGFISHHERDPARRTDPGEAFPWAQFLTEYARAMGTDTGGGLLADLTEAEQHEVLRLVRRIEAETAGPLPEARLAETLVLVRGLAGVDPLEPADVAAGGDARQSFKTLLIGALGTGLAPPPATGPTEAGQGSLIAPFKRLLREVLAEQPGR